MNWIGKLIHVQLIKKKKTFLGRCIQNCLHCFLIYLPSSPNRNENKAKPRFSTFRHDIGNVAPRNQRQTCLKQNASCLLLVAEAKLSNFGINGTSIWKNTSMETASGILLAMYVAELSCYHLGGHCYRKTDSYSIKYTFTNQPLLCYEMVSEHLGCLDTQCDIAGPWYTGAPNTFCLRPSSPKSVWSCKTSKSTLGTITRIGLRTEQLWSLLDGSHSKAT